ncbi:MAG: four helix bundle protein [Verrucomicrobiota bacterium]
MENETDKFAFEDLKVWQEAVAYNVAILELSEELSQKKRHFRILKQLEASSLSVAQNIAEGKGRRSKKEFIQYCYIARGSLYESVTILVSLHKAHMISASTLSERKTQSIRIAKMINALINSLNA